MLSAIVLLYWISEYWHTSFSKIFRLYDFGLNIWSRFLKK